MGIGLGLFLQRVRRVVGAQHIDEAGLRAPARGRRGDGPRAPAGSSGSGCRAARSHRRRRSDDAASPRRWRYPCWRRAAAIPRRSRYAAHGCACRLRAPGAAGARCRGARPRHRARRDGWRDRPRRCSSMRARRRNSSSLWKAARRRMLARMRATPSSSSTRRSPVDEPMNTLMPAQPGSRSSSPQIVGIVARAADVEGEIAMHAVGGAAHLVGERFRRDGQRAWCWAFRRRR